MSAGVAAPPPKSGFPYRCFPLPLVRQEIVDPADTAAVAWLFGLLQAGRADLYVEDEADLALLPSLTRTWMRRGEQRRVEVPGTNEKRSVAAATDIADGTVLWEVDLACTAAQFGLMLQSCVQRSTRRRRLAILLVDNAQSHRVGQKGLLRKFMRANAGRVVLVFLPPYSPDLQPTERLWRQWRPSATHNHTRRTIEALIADSDAWFERQSRDPQVVLRDIGTISEARPYLVAA